MWNWGSWSTGCCRQETYYCYCASASWVVDKVDVVPVVHVDPGAQVIDMVQVDPGANLNAMVQVDPGADVYAMVYVDPRAQDVAVVHVGQGICKGNCYGTCGSWSTVCPWYVLI